jgi:hypothetical protein
MDAEGNAQTRLTTNTLTDTSPSWSPDGSKIAFQSSRDLSTSFEVYVMNPDGSAQTRLTTNPAFDGVPSWSPDAARILFTSGRDGNNEIYVMNANGSAPTRLTESIGSDTSATYSPDGTKIAFTSTRDGNAEIYVMNADGSSETRLTRTSATESTPTWSPDGSKIAFASTAPGNIQIFVMNANGSGQTRLTFDQANDLAPNWQHDVPGAPTGVSASAGNAEATVSFTPPASTGGAAITSYRVTSDPGGLQATGTGSPITVSGLTNGTPYTFTVRAINAVGAGPASSPSDPVTPAGPPGAPRQVTAVPGNARATVSFAPPSSTGGEPIQSYTVTSSPGGVVATDSGSPLTVTGLTNGTAYTFTVRATNVAGTGPPSDPSNEITPDGTAPTVTATDITVAATSPDGALVPAYGNVTASDTGSGVDTIVCSPPAPHLFPVGDATVSCTATDRAGNPSAPTTFAVHVVGVEAQLGELSALVDAYDLSKPLDDRLQKHLAAAAGGWASDDTDTFCGALDDFADDVLEEAGRDRPELTISEAQSLTAELYKVETVGGCIAPTSVVPQGVDDALDLIGAVNDIVTAKGLANSLRGLATTAARQIADPDPAVGCNALADFVAKVQTETGRKLTATNAATLLGAAGVVQIDVGCG